jgi:uncharacterized membrane protein
MSSNTNIGSSSFESARNDTGGARERSGAQARWSPAPGASRHRTTRDRGHYGRSVERSPGEDQTWAEVLGWVSMGLGLTALLVPGPLGRATGLEGRTTLLRLVGMRELASGVGLLTQRRKAPWLWARVGGDLLDLLLLATAGAPGIAARRRALGSAAAVAAIGAADVMAALRVQDMQASSAPELYVEECIAVNSSPADCYAFWRDLENVRRFTRNLQQVTALDERRSLWVMRGPGGTTLEWESELTMDNPGKRLAWRTTQDADFTHAGSVDFSAAPGNRGTFVRVSMHYTSPGGILGTRIGQLLGRDPRGDVRETLRQFKRLIETGELPTTEGQSSGRRSLLGRLTPEGRRSRTSQNQESQS